MNRSWYNVDNLFFIIFVMIIAGWLSWRVMARSREVIGLIPPTSGYTHPLLGQDINTTNGHFNQNEIVKSLEQYL